MSLLPSKNSGAAQLLPSVASMVQYCPVWSSIIQCGSVWSDQVQREAKDADLNIS